MHPQSRDLFQLQSELVDMKVNMAISKEIDRVIAELSSFKRDMHSDLNDLKSDMNGRFSSLDNRVIAVETKLGITNETRKLIRSKIIDYSFQSIWLLLGTILAYVLMHLK